MGWNATSGLCLSESESGNFSPFAIGIGVAILDRTTGATSVNTTTTNTTTSGNASSNTSTAKSEPDHDNNTTKIIPRAIGRGVAVSAGVLLISAGVFSLWRPRKRRAQQAFQQFDMKNSAPSTPYTRATSYNQPVPYSPPSTYGQPVSQEPTGHIIELEHSPRRCQGLGIQELDGHHGSSVSQYK